MRSWIFMRSWKFVRSWIFMIHNHTFSCWNNSTYLKWPHPYRHTHMYIFICSTYIKCDKCCFMMELSFKMWLWDYLASFFFFLLWKQWKSILLPPIVNKADTGSHAGRVWTAQTFQHPLSVQLIIKSVIPNFSRHCYLHFGWSEPTRGNGARC